MIEAEEAQIDRWFGRGPVGPLFFADDGRTYSVTERQMAGWRTEGRSRLYMHVADGGDQMLIAVGLCVLGLLLGGGLAGLAGFSHSAMVGTGIGAAIPALMLVPYTQMLALRKELAAYRGEIAAQLSRSSPVSGELAEPYRADNPYRTLQHATMIGGILIVLTVSLLPGLLGAKGLGLWLYLLMPVIGIAGWSFHLAADERDRALDDERRRNR